MRGYINDPTEISNIYSEYLRLIKSFQDLTRQSIFLRYFNIDTKASIFDQSVEGSFDRYKSGIVFNAYDFVPTLNTGQLINNAQERSDLTGQKFDGNLEVVVYSIPKPRFGDIITFPYKPLSKKEVFRVKTISTPLNSHRKSVTYFTLGLEYASIKDTKDLKIAKPFVYLLPTEKNIDQVLYKQILFSADKINTLFQSLVFDSSLELYVDANNIAPLNINKQIYDSLISNRFFDKIKRPFGICKYPTLVNTGISLNDQSIDKTIISITENKPTTLNIVDYNLDQNNLIYDINKFLSDFILLLQADSSNIPNLTTTQIKLLDDVPNVTVGNQVLIGSNLVEVTNLLNVNVDNITIGVNTNNQIEVKDGSITKSKLGSDIAGSGLKQNIDGSLALNIVNSEVLSGLKDGTNLTFTLKNKPSQNSENIYFNGVRLNRLTDYSLIGNILTLNVTAPLSDDSLIADYYV